MTWDKALANTYDHWFARVTDDIPFYVRLARRRGAGRCPLPRMRVDTGVRPPRRFRRQ